MADLLEDSLYELTIDQSPHDRSFLHSTNQNRKGDRQYPTDRDCEGDQSSHGGSLQRFIAQYRESDQQYASGHDHGCIKQYLKDKMISDVKEEEDSKKETGDREELQQDKPNDDGANNDDEEDAKMEEMVNEDFQDKCKDHYDIDPTEWEVGHGGIKGVYEEDQQRSQSPSASVKVISEVDDDEQVRGRPDMLFVQEQETTTAGEGVSGEADPRHRQCGYQSDGMWTQDGVLQEQGKRQNEDTAKMMIYDE